MSTTGSRQVEPSPYVLIRYNLLRSDRAIRVRDPAAAMLERCLARLWELEAWKREHREHVTEHLYERVPLVTDEQRRRVVLPLRRDVFNNRRPGRYADRVAEVTSDPTTLRWIEVEEEVAALSAEVARLHAGLLQAERARLIEVTSQPEFQKSFVLSSPLAFRAQADYRRHPGADSKRVRRAEASLVRYYTRALAKTSPFSRYTAVAVGTWDTRDLPGGLGDPGPVVRSSVRANQVLVLRLVDLAVCRPGSRHGMRYHLARRTVIDGDRVRFEVDTDDPANQPRVFRTTEKVLALPATPTLCYLVRWMQQRPDGALFQELEHLIRSAGGSAAPHKTTAFLERLVTAGLLVPALPLDEQDPKFLTTAVRLLEELPEEPCRVAARHLSAVADEVARFGDLAAPDRDEALQRIQAGWRSAYRVLGGRVADDTFPLFEDSAGVRTVPVSLPAWRETLDQLRRVERLAAVFDDYYVLHAMVRDAFVGRFGVGGTCTDLNDLAALLPTAYERAWQVATGWTDGIDVDDPVTAAQLSLRKEFTDHLAALMSDADEECELRPDVVDDLYRRLPERIRREWTSWSMFVQPEVRDGRIGRVVLNKVYAGVGQFTSRFLSLLGDGPTDLVRSHVRRFFPADRVVTELRPVFGFNANIHPLLAEREIDWDGRGGAHRIDLSDISVRHDPAADELVMHRTSSGQRLEVLYLGFLIPYALPYRLASFYAVNGRGQMQLNFPDLVDRQRPPGDAGRVRHYPRVRLGNVVLARRRWYVPRAEVPLRGQQEPEAAYYRRLNLWRLTHGLPAEVFYKELRDFELERSTVSGDQLQRELAKVRAKPQYLDLTTALGARMFDRWLRNVDDDLQFEEVLPALADSALRMSDGPHAAELIIELNHRPWARGNGHG